MKALARTALVLALAAMAATAPTTASGAISCHKINAKGVGQDHGDGTTSARILGGGLLHGTTEAVFVITGFDPPVASFVGTITFTVNKGTLTAEVEGTFNTETGEFSADSTSISGTGKLEGATGNLAFDGVEDLSTGRFTERVTGEICVDLS